MDKNPSLVGEYGIVVDLGHYGIPAVGNLILREDGSVAVNEYSGGRVYTCAVRRTRDRDQRTFILEVKQLAGDRRTMFISRHPDNTITFDSTKRWKFGQRPLMTNPRLLEVLEYLTRGAG